MARKVRLSQSMDQVQLKLRFREYLRYQLARQAKQNGRSLNAEIVFRLNESFRYDRIQEEADNLVRRSSFDDSVFVDTARHMIKDLYKLLMKEMAEAQVVAAQKLKAKPEDESK